MRLAPAAVVMRADEHVGDIELAFFDIGDLQASLRSRGGAAAVAAGACVAAAAGALVGSALAAGSSRGRCRRRCACADDHRENNEEGQYAPEPIGDMDTPPVE